MTRDETTVNSPPQPDRAVHCFDNDDDLTYVPPDPFKLKQLGNDAYANKDRTLAIELWKQSLKEALKKSVTAPSRELSDLQMLLRLNLARGFFEEEDYVMAKEHLTVVYENQPENKKVYYRFGEVYLALWDYDRAREVVKEGLERFPNDPALITMQRRVEHEEKLYERDLKNALKKRVNLKLQDERAQSVPETIVPFDRERYSKILNGDGTYTEAEMNKFCHDLIDWRHDTSAPVANETPTDIDDWKNSREWNRPHNAETLKHDRTAQYLSLPLSILAVLENALRITKMDTTVDPTASNLHLLQRSTIMKSEHNQISLPPLPKSEAEVMGLRLRNDVTEWLSRHRKPRPFTIHVLGARGDAEMECKWSAMLDRMPHVDVLQVCMIGFTDPDDPYSRRLKEPGYLSPPLSKRNGIRGSQKFIARLFKGTYREFLTSEKVLALCTKKEFINNAANDFLQIDETHKAPLHPVLLFDEHPLHPDLIVIPEPNMSAYFDSWAPDLAQIILSNIPTILLGHSVVEGALCSHEANQFASIIPRFGARTVVPLMWNPFSLIINPEVEGCPPPPAMPIVNETTGETIMFMGLSGKYAVTMMIRGVADSGSKAHLADLISSPDYVRQWRKKLSGEGLDVDRALNATSSYFNDANIQKDAEKREAEIEEKAQEIRNMLNARL